jgi:hypothetical protein
MSPSKQPLRLGTNNVIETQFKRWQFIAAVDVITELLLFVLAIVLLKGLFMSMRRKLAIGFAFIFRFP